MIDGAIAVEESEVPDGFPYPRTSVCGARRQVARLARQDVKLLPMLNVTGDPVGADTGWWASFDPTQLPTCSRCSFLPVCWAGCPKRHLDSDAEAIAEQGAYWRRNLPRLVSEGTGERLERDLTLDSGSQFRD